MDQGKDFSKLLPVMDAVIDGKGQPVISARDVYKALNIKTSYSHWINRNIKKYGFVGGVDFVSFLTENKHRGRPSTDHCLSIGMAKELFMVSRGAVAKQVRLYFIEIERAYKATYESATLSRAEFLLEQAKAMLGLEREQQAAKLERQDMRVDIERLDARQEMQAGNTGFYTITAFCKLHKLKIPLNESRTRGKRASKLSKEHGIRTGETPDERFGSVKSYHKDVLEEVFEDMLSGGNQLFLT